MLALMCKGPGDEARGSRTLGSSLILRKCSWRIQNFGIISDMDSVYVFVSVIMRLSTLTEFVSVSLAALKRVHRVSSELDSVGD